ncbi:MAG: periplasmic heavy metal sensor [Desulfobacteraceae bacterium]|jgi:Spy/CpxP family protein refolding chaperone
MKTLVVVLGLITLIALSSHPVLAMGHGMGGHGGGGSGMGNWGESLWNWWQEWQHRGGYQNPAGERRRQREELEQRYYRQTAELKKAIETKSAELDDLLNSPNPDMERVRTLHNEIKGLRAELEDQRIEHDREMRRLGPTAPYSGEYSRRSYDAPQGQYSRGIDRGGRMGGHGGVQY